MSNPRTAKRLDMRRSQRCPPRRTTGDPTWDKLVAYGWDSVLPPALFTMLAEVWLAEPDDAPTAAELFDRVELGPDEPYDMDGPTRWISLAGDYPFSLGSYPSERMRAVERFLPDSGSHLVTTFAEGLDFLQSLGLIRAEAEIFLPAKTDLPLATEVLPIPATIEPRLLAALRETEQRDTTRRELVDSTGHSLLSVLFAMIDGAALGLWVPSEPAVTLGPDDPFRLYPELAPPRDSY